MKAFVIEKPGVCSFQDRPQPVLLPGTVLLQIKRVGFCGSDLNTFRGRNPLVAYPRIPGHEVGAVIVETAAGVPTHLQPGLAVTVAPYTNCGACGACRRDRPNACRNNQTLGVQRDGILTEYLVVPWEKILYSPILSLTELALVEPLSVGFHAVRRGRVMAAETVVVLGCGMIGLGAVAGAALWKEARVIAVDISEDKLALARKGGAVETINTKTESLHARLEALTGGPGPAVIIEAAGVPETYLAAVQAASFAGRVVFIGYAQVPVAYETKYFVMKELDLLGSRNALPEDFAQVITVLESGRYPAAETITRTVPFAQAGEALRHWSEHPATVTKIQVALG